MSGLRYLTAGESHGQAVLTILEGLPAGLPLNEEYIERDLRRRQGGYGRGGRMAIERDHAEILSGVRFGKTLGSPVALLIRNRDWENWTERMSVAPVEGAVEAVTRMRPGHADLPGAIKYGFDDVRNVLERASARETSARVAAGGVARRLLEEFGVRTHSHVVAIGGAHAGDGEAEPDWESVEASPVRCADAQAASRMTAAIDAAKQEGDTVGGVIEVWTTGLPIGLGSYVHWDRKLDGRLAQAICSINAFKGVDFGAGFRSADARGSATHDVILPRDRWPDDRPWAHATNHHGGIEGGMTTGEPLVLRAAVKPIPTLAHPLPSVDLRTGGEVTAHYERSDVCVVPAAGVVAEAMVSLIVADAFLEKFGGDTLDDLRAAYEHYRARAWPQGTGPADRRGEP